MSLADTPHAAEVLAAGAEVLDRLGVRWWLSSGTALGLWRDGALIPHDTDLDVDVLGLEHLPAIHAAFTVAGWPLIREMPYQRAYQPRGVIFDVYAYRRDAGNLVADTDCGQLTMPASLVDELADVAYGGRTFPMPSPPESYLVVRYGEAWRTPRTGKRPWAQDAANLSR